MTARFGGKCLFVGAIVFVANAVMMLWQSLCVVTTMKEEEHTVLVTVATAGCFT